MARSESLPEAAPAETTARNAWFAARYRLPLYGCLCIVAANAIAYGDGGYDFFSPVFLAILALSFFLSAAVALPLARSRTGQAAVFAFGITYFVDVAYIGGGWISALSVIFLCAYLIFLIAYRKSETIVPFAATACAFATLFILPQQFLSQERVAPSAFDLSGAGTGGGRPYVHIILDEMSPVDLMPAGAYYDALKARMVRDYESRGFTLLNDTQVTAGSTHVSLGHVLAESDQDHENYGEGAAEFTYAVGENRIAALLAEQGYRVSLLQNSYLETCTSADWDCKTYARSGDGSAIDRYLAGFGARLSYALLDLHYSLVTQESVRGSVYYEAAGKAASLLGIEVPRARLFLARPPLVLNMMERAERALAELGDGEALLAHLLLPHFPYVLTGDCAMKSTAERQAPRWATRPDGEPFRREETERAYWEQAACTHSALMKMIDAVIGTPEGKDALILVHGDHGSRLYEKVAYPEADPASAEERRHALSTHFAIRGLADRGADLAARPMLRDRIDIVMDEIASLGPGPDSGLVTAATGATAKP